MQRTSTRLEATISPVGEGGRVDRIGGAVAWDLEQSVLDASRFLLRRPPEVVPEDDPERSWFEMIRVAADAADAHVREVADAAFEARG